MKPKALMRSIVCSTKKQPRKTRGCFLCCNTASGMDCMQCSSWRGHGGEPPCFNTASGMDCMQCFSIVSSISKLSFQYRKRYGLHAMWRCGLPRGCSSPFQYRKRYGLHAISKGNRYIGNQWEFQYRKRYGLHAIRHAPPLWHHWCCFNTASGMDCMQFANILNNDLRCDRFNTASGMDCMQ